MFLLVFILSLLLLLCFIFFYFFYEIFTYKRVKEELITDNSFNTFGKADNRFNTFGKATIYPLLNDKKWTKYVDKLEFKELCKQKGIKTFKTLQILNDPNDLYELHGTLPNDFIIKSNKGSGQNYIVRNSKHLSVKEYEETINKALHFLKNWKNPGYGEQEKQYNFTKPQLFIEELIDPIPNDIKIFVYQNIPTVMMIKDTSGTMKIYSYKIHTDYTITQIKDCFWKQNVEKQPSKTIEDIRKKGKLKQMFETVCKFKVDIPLVRIDLYWYKNEFYGGEVTLSSGNFQDKFNEICASHIFQFS